MSLETRNDVSSLVYEPRGSTKKKKKEKKQYTKGDKKPLTALCCRTNDQRDLHLAETELMKTLRRM